MALFGAIGSTQAVEITVYASGTAVGDAGPQFRVDLDGTEIGNGTVPAENSRKSASYSFEVDDALLKADSVVGVVFLNDEKSDGADRNLYVHQIKVGARLVEATNLAAVNKEKAIKRPVNYGYIELWNTGDEAVASAPNGNWLNTCDATASVSFPNGIFTVEGEQPALQPLVEQAKLNQCVLRVRGYSSVSGDEETNKAMSGARAEGVRNYLLGLGLKFSSVAVEAMGETSTFGPAERDNRIAVITLESP
ncbi:carbohydrate-binding domain-containing protein [Devosia sp. CN2-171]|uniref:carbohydrate-binding domain-containing protein n=1 Tax=Devosia sp. CN2-171 TaxID=3400909 RepID=UPI003BF915BD